MKKILSQIEENRNVVKTKLFTDITKLSYYADEKVILFMVESIFRFQKILYDQENQIWIIDMILSSDDEPKFKEILNLMRQQIGSGETNLRILAKIFWKMGKLDLIEKYLERLLNELSSNDPLVGDLYEDLDEIA